MGPTQVFRVHWTACSEHVIYLYRSLMMVIPHFFYCCVFFPLSSIHSGPAIVIGILRWHQRLLLNWYFVFRVSVVFLFFFLLFFLFILMLLCLLLSRLNTRCAFVIALTPVFFFDRSGSYLYSFSFSSVENRCNLLFDYENRFL